MVDIANESHRSTTTKLPERAARHQAATPDTTFSVTGGTATATRYLLAGIRIALGWVFLWAFLDKLFGLGRSTPAANAWLEGGSPTAGFLGKAATGPFSGMYHAIAGNAFVDMLFMTALLGIGVALLLGIGMRIAAASGALLTVLMWTAVLPPATNPFMDDHLVYAAVLVLLALLGAGTTWGLGRRWAATPLVRRNTWLT
ncbi:DoxX family membrane protein [Actinoplanes xinjiangensis]|uniref:Thiosulfate dehydrogenase [quinone] large subunit n=1 Tax=Actinoplanes xinjiangensis TaxID=512350 RepID=A0A316EAT4_9ACTN|nr:DoxX family membrane protein [Actinoplanes xinjiangensis]PWK26439.1 thiosulfate dehydrogenase [quinone] large subunit [Actinoplanes xinjiangensis]GIF45236.1 membrane protein [Actinoplanes xinjiangensis]